MDEPEREVKRIILPSLMQPWPRSTIQIVPGGEGGRQRCITARWASRHQVHLYGEARIDGATEEKGGQRARR